MNKAVSNKNFENISFWYDPDKRSVIYQIGAACLFVFVAWYLVSNTITNLESQSIATGFGFLGNEAAFEMKERILEFLKKIAFDAFSSPAEKKDLLGTFGLSFELFQPLKRGQTTILCISHKTHRK